MTTIKPFENTGQFTTFDNAILDYIMPLCKPNTWKILCATIRKTRGWNKDEDSISLSQFAKMTGIKNRSTVVSAIQDAIELGFLICDKNKMTNSYSLNKQYEIRTSLKNGLVQKSYQKQSKNRTRTSPKNGHTKESKDKKEIKNIEIPVNLCTDEFKTSWEDFKLHRKQIKKPMSDLAEIRMLKKLSKQSVEVAIDMIDESISNGWQGVFEPKDRNWNQPDQNIPEGV
jgi:phage replication O-like protein O